MSDRCKERVVWCSVQQTEKKNVAVGLSTSGHSQASFIYPNRGIYWATVGKEQKRRGLMWPWPCVQGSKAIDPRRGEVEVNKANQRLALISLISNPRRLAGAAHVTVSRHLSQLVRTMRLKAISPGGSVQGTATIWYHYSQSVWCG